MKKITYDVSVCAKHESGLPGYVSEEVVNLFTDSARGNLIINDSRTSRPVVLPYTQLQRVSYGERPADISVSIGAGRGSFGTAGAVGITASGAKKYLIVEYIGATGTPGTLVFSDHQTTKNMADLVAILQQNTARKSGTTFL